MNIVDLANEWRETWGYIGRAGVVVVYEGEVQGWVNELRNPEHWRPGCVAVGEDGRSWTAIIGNDYDGALMWIANDLLPESP